MKVLCPLLILLCLGAASSADEPRSDEVALSLRQSGEVLKIPPPSSLPAMIWREALGSGKPQKAGRQARTLSLTQAVFSALDANPQIQIEETRVIQREGQLLEATGEFDTNVATGIGGRARRDELRLNERALNERAQNQNFSTETEALLNWEAGLRRRLRNGIRLEPKVEMSSKRRNTSAGFANENITRVVFNVIIPLGRNSGVAVAAPEIAAQYDLLASTFALRNITARNVADTVRAYWRLLAAQERLRLLRQSEEAAQNLLVLTEALVEADELARSDIFQALADRETATAQRMAAENELVDARLNLATLAGYPPETLPNAPYARDPFPEPPKSTENLTNQLQDLWFLALILRDDLQALRELEKSRKILLQAAVVNLQPRADLALDGSWQPQNDRSAADSYQRSGGLGGGFAFNIEWPLGNDFARGQLLQQEALLSRSELDSYDLERRIVAGVVRSVAALRSSAARANQLASASRNYEQALLVQEELFALGQGSLTDTITARQRMIGAQLDYVRAREEYAASIIELRYQTGTLLPNEDGQSWVSSALWMQPPFLTNNSP